MAKRRKDAGDDSSILGILIVILLGSLGFIRDHWAWFAAAGVILLGLVLFIFFLKRAKKRNAPQIAVKDMTGIEFEDYVAKRMKEAGYTDVRTTEKTGDFGADVIGKTPKGLKIAVQCKHYKTKVGIASVQEVNSARDYYKTDLAAVVTNSSFTSAAKKLASKSNVILIDDFDDNSTFRL